MALSVDFEIVLSDLAGEVVSEAMKTGHVRISERRKIEVRHARGRAQ